MLRGWNSHDYIHMPKDFCCQIEQQLTSADQNLKALANMFYKFCLIVAHTVYESSEVLTPILLG